MKFSTVMKASILWLAIVSSSIAGCHYALADYSVGGSASSPSGKPGGPHRH